MRKIDRLGWAAGLCFDAYGVRVGIRVNKPEFLEGIRSVLPPGGRETPRVLVDRLYSLLMGSNGTQTRVRRFHLVYAGVGRLARTMDLEEALGTLESDLQLYVASAARDRVFVHAGAVGWRGRAIVLPGRSCSGKTSLVAALVRAGATYYSDEYAVLDVRGRVHPYPKPLSIREGPDARPRKCPAEALGVVGVKPLPVGLVVVSRFEPHARWRPRLLSPGEAILELLANTVSARVRPRRALATLDQVVRQAPAVKGKRGEAEQVAAAVLDRLGG